MSAGVCLKAARLYTVLACNFALKKRRKKKFMKVKMILAPNVREMLSYLAKDLKQDGRSNLIFAEDRLTLEAERAIVSESGGSFTASVTTFARFLSGEYTGRVLTKQGSVITVGAIAAKCAKNLRCFTKNPAGCAAELYETIAQLRAALVTPEMLKEAIPFADEVLSEKLKDIALIYRAYLDFLSSGYLDESAVLELLPQAMQKSGKVCGANVYFVGFASFTRQAAEGIRAAVGCARSVTGIFIGGTEEIYTNESANAFEKYCLECGAEVEKIYLSGESCTAAESLRAALFNPEIFRKAKAQTDAVVLYEAADEEDELSFIASMIKKEIFDGLRYRDITLLLPDVSAYAIALEKVFSEYKIPYFADVKKSILYHPLCRFALDYCKLVYDGCTCADAESFVGSVFFEENAALRDGFKNYLLQYANYRGGLRRPVKENVLLDAEKELRVLQERACRMLSHISSHAEGSAFCAAIRALLRESDAENVQKNVAKTLNEAGYSAESEYFSKGYESLIRVLDETEQLTRGVRLSAEEFAALLSESLQSLEISLIPQFTDAVFVGSLSESKKCAGKILFAASLTSQVPAAGADTALISDKDIDRLRALKVEIQPKIREVNARARESTALSIASFTKRLYLSYPLSVGGKECKKSEIFDYVSAAIARKNGAPLVTYTRGSFERWERENGAAYARYLSCVASERVPALKELLSRADRYRKGAADFKAHNGLYFALKKSGENVESMLDCVEQSGFIPNAAELLFRGRREISPTFIEGYFSCPYKNFSERGLRLAPRNEGAVKPLDTGDFMHAVLQRTAERFPLFKSEEECVRYAESTAENVLSQPPFCFLKDTGAGSFTFSSLLNEAGIVAAEFYRQIADSAFTVWGAEKTFGGRGADFAGLTLLSGEHELQLSGKIDRIDRGGDYVRVIDYKTGSIVEADADSYYTGRKMQLQLYMRAVSAYATPAGAYYFPARVAYAKKGEDYPFRMLGFSLADEEALKMSDTAMEKGEKSRYVNVTLGKSADKQMSGEDFEPFIDYSRLAALSCAREIEKGCIAPSPYHEVCDYCPYGGVCGADAKKTARKERTIKCAEIAKIVKRRRGER